GWIRVCPFERLDRYPPLMLEVVCEVDRGHRALTDLTIDAVLAADCRPQLLCKCHLETRSDLVSWGQYKAGRYPRGARGVHASLPVPSRPLRSIAHPRLRPELLTHPAAPRPGGYLLYNGPNDSREHAFSPSRHHSRNRHRPARTRVRACS